MALAANLWRFSSLVREPMSAGYDRCCRDVGLTHTPKLLRELHISGNRLGARLHAGCGRERLGSG